MIVYTVMSKNKISMEISYLMTFNFIFKNIIMFNFEHDSKRKKTA